MMVRYSLFVLSLLFATVAQSKTGPVRLPFQNLSFPINGVSDCWTYSQTLETIKNGSRLICPSNDIVFYSDSSRNVRPVVDGLVAGVHQIYDNWVVVVKHENYYFSYFGLGEVFVNKGDSVCAEIILGRTRFDEESKKYSVGMQLDTEKGTFNPESIFNYSEKDSMALSQTLNL